MTFSASGGTGFATAATVLNRAVESFLRPSCSSISSWRTGFSEMPSRADVSCDERELQPGISLSTALRVHQHP